MIKYAEKESMIKYAEKESMIRSPYCLQFVKASLLVDRVIMERVE